MSIGGNLKSKAVSVTNLQSNELKFVSLPLFPLCKQQKSYYDLPLTTNKISKKTHPWTFPLEFVQINPRVGSLQAAATIRAVCGLESATWDSPNRPTKIFPKLGGGFNIDFTPQNLGEMMKKMMEKNWLKKTDGSTNHKESQLRVPFLIS